MTITAIHGYLVRLTAVVGVFIPIGTPHWDFSDTANSFYLGW